VTVYRFRFVKKHRVIARDICGSVVALTLVRINQLGLGEKAVTSKVSFVSRFNYRVRASGNDSIAHLLVNLLVSLGYLFLRWPFR
jgi:hypothetical protein